MELYKEILSHVLENEEMHIVFPNITKNLADIVEGECYQAIQKIQAILKDDTLNDQVCSEKIEEIVCLFEDMGISCGNRHDF